VYLPEGQWYDWWTSAVEAGGRTVTRQVDLATMPIYVRAGAIIPMDPVRQHTAEEVEGPLTLRVYQGANGEYTLYGDDGISLDYLQGEATWTRITWDDAARTLAIEPAPPPPGASPVARTYDFRVQLVPEGPTRDVTYSGERVEVVF
jgi:alpha-glucosidase/alpha-D-xyloside xylohydrolase